MIQYHVIDTCDVVFQIGLEEDKDCLFDRIADSYVALFTSINTDVKDKFLSVSLSFFPSEKCAWMCVCVRVSFMTY